MAQCLNCKSSLSCGCQRRTASNGASVCANCLAAYEQKLKGGNLSRTITPTTAPNQVGVKYNPKK